MLMLMLMLMLSVHRAPSSFAVDANGARQTILPKEVFEDWLRHLAFVERSPRHVSRGRHSSSVARPTIFTGLK